MPADDPDRPQSVPRRILRNTRLALLAWTAVVAILLAWFVSLEDGQVIALAQVEAKANLLRDLALRDWATSHGGIYVPVDEVTRPSPFLAHIPERDVHTPRGRTLTLYNPAMMLREMKQTEKELYGVLARITGRTHLNPDNAPDAWEDKALSIVESTRQDYWEATQINGQPFLRRMQPMFMEEGCVKCHAWTGIKVGEVRGATDIAVPLAPYQAVVDNSKRHGALLHGIAWLAGLGLIGFMSRRSRKNALILALHTDEIRKFELAVKQSASGVMITDTHGRIVYANPQFLDTNGYSEAEVIGQKPSLLKSGETAAAVYQEMWSSISQGQVWRGELKNRRKSGEPYWCLETISPLRNEAGRVVNYVAIAEDISDRKFAEAAIHRLAYFDPLTELPNRRLLRDRLEQAIAWSARSQTKVALLYLDLDRFKTFNDSLGHPVGDAILVEMATRFTTCLRDNDTLARLGGDEFAIVAGNINGPQDAVVVAEKLLHQIQAPFTHEGFDLYVTTSIGIALCPDDSEDLDILLRCADVALYEAKAGGRNGYRFFARDVINDSLERLAIENGLRTVIERNELFVEYQPKLDLRSGRITSVEALMRWRHPTLGLVSPARFIPLAEEVGEICRIGAWILHEACRQTAQWRMQGLDLKVSVNISAIQFGRPELVETVRQTLTATGLEPSALELEITESALARDPEQASEALTTFRRMGLGISIDDFGTGYSSLNYLKNFPMTVLKIDRSFVSELGTPQSNDKAIVGAVIFLSRSLGLEVVAEGVETQEQLHILRTMGCDHIQGYYLSKPLGADQLEQFLRTHGDTAD